MASLNAVNRLTEPYVANSKVIFRLPLGGRIRRGNVVLTGNVVVSGGTTSGTAQGEGGPTNLISRIKVTATPMGGSRYPGGRIVDCTPRSLLRFAVAEHGGKLILEQSGSTLGGGAANTYSIYLSIPIYWADANYLPGQQLAAALNTDDASKVPGGTYQSVQVEVDTANLAACFTGNDRTVDYSGLQVQWVDDRVDGQGDTIVRFQEDHELIITAANKRALDPAMPQDGSFEWLQILAEEGAAQNLSDALLNRLTIQGPTLTFDKYAQDMRQGSFDDEYIDPAQTATGMYFVDLTDGALQNSVPANGLQFNFDVSNPSGASLDDLLIYTRRLFAPIPAKSSTTGK